MPCLKLLHCCQQHTAGAAPHAKGSCTASWQGSCQPRGAAFTVSCSPHLGSLAVRPGETPTCQPPCCLHDTRSSLPLPGLTPQLSPQKLLRQLLKSSGSASRGLPTRSIQAARQRSRLVAAAAGLLLLLLLLAEVTPLTAPGLARPRAAAEGHHTSQSSATPPGGLLCLHRLALRRPHTNQAAS